MRITDTRQYVIINSSNNTCFMSRSEFIYLEKGYLFVERQSLGGIDVFEVGENEMREKFIV